MKRLVIMTLIGALCTTGSISNASAHRKARRTRGAQPPAVEKIEASPLQDIDSQTVPTVSAPATAPSERDESGVSDRATGGSSDPGARMHEECPPADRRCILDRRLDYIENKTMEVHESYQDHSAWKMPEETEEKKPGKTKYGTKALKYPLELPKYIFKVFTWPLAAIANEMIKHGVIRTTVDLVSNDARTFWVYPTIEFGFGSGFGGGVGIKHYDLFHRNFKLDANYTIHINMDQEAFLALGKPNIAYIAGRPLAFRVTNKFKHHNDDNFYGIGIGSSDSSAKYGIDELESGGWLGYEVLKNFLLRLHLYYIWDDTEAGSTGQSVNARFPASDIAAFGKSIQYLDVGLGLVHDTRDCTAAPERGGIQKFAFRRYFELGSTDYDYNEFDFEAVHYFQVWRPRHVFALRTAWIYQNETDNRIPFYRLARLDVNSPDRSYPSGRFRDRARYVFNVEYRFPVWEYMDGQIFWDFGRVFHEWSDLSLKYLKHSVGVGIRLRTKDFFLLRLQVAGGSEGVKVLFKTSQAF